MLKVWNKRDPLTPKDALYVGRPTKWGNPYVIGRDGTRAEVIAKYKDFLTDLIYTSDLFMADLHELRGRDLVCWCAPKACHADVLLELANR